MSFKATIAAVSMGMLAFSGCATAPTRSYQPDIDSLNSKVSNLQGQLASKDEEIARLQSEVNSQSSALRQTQADNEALSQRLNDASSKLSASSKPAAKAYDSDLK